MYFLNKMKKQNGFSQIFVMVVMLILAVALPITANLVKKVQDNRSSAAGKCPLYVGPVACQKDTNCDWNGLRCVEKPTCSATKCGDCATAGACAIDGCKWSYSGNYCEKATTLNCTVGAKRCTNNTVDVCSDRLGGWTFSYNCPNGCNNDGSCKPATCSSTKCGNCGTVGECNGVGCKWSYSGNYCEKATVSSNPYTEKWQTGAVGSGAKCTAAGGVCGDYTSTPVDGESCMVGGRIENGVIASGLCSGDTTVKCCKPSGSAPAPSTPTDCGEVRNQCDGNNLNHCDGKNWSLITACVAGCDSSNNTCKDECTLGQTPTCPTSTTRQFCNKDADNGIRLKTETCPNGCEAGVCKSAPTPTPIVIKIDDPVCTPGEKQCSGATARVCKNDGTDWTDIACGAIGCNAITKVCNECTPGSQKCTATNKYFTCTTDGNWSTTTTNCSGSQVCTVDNVGTTVCKDPDYTAPKLNLYFAISGVKKLDSCFGNLKFNVTVTKDGSNTVTSREVTATVVDNRFNTNLGDQIFKISDFALTNDYALTDKIKITIGSNRKILATIYGKDSQNAGFPALNKSQILVSDLANKTLSLFDYPILNGDIGTQGSLGTQDKVVNGADFAFMKNEWGKTCKSGENLNADLNGDCRVDTFDLQILKNAMAEQYSQKTD